MDLEQHSRANNVIISALKIRPQNLLQAVKVISEENDVVHEETTEEQVSPFLRKCDIKFDKKKKTLRPVTHHQSGSLLTDSLPHLLVLQIVLLRQ